MMTQALLSRIRRDKNFIELLRYSGILYVGGVFSLMLTFAQQISTAGLLGAEDYGRFAIIMSSSLLILLIADFRTWEVGTKYITIALSRQDQPEIVRVISWLLLVEVLASVVAMLLVILLAGLIADLFLQSSDIAHLIAVYALSIPFRTLTSGILGILPRIYNRFGWLAIKSIGYASFRLVFITGAAVSGWGLPGVVIGALFSEIAGFVLLLLIVLVIRRAHLRHTRIWDWSRPHLFAEGRRMLGTLWLSSSLAGLHYQTFIPIIAMLTTPAQVGLIRIGLDIAELLERLIQPISIVFTPRIMLLYQAGNYRTFYRYLKQCAAMLALIVLPVVLGVLLVWPLFVTMLLSDGEFSQVTPVLNLLMIGFALHTILQWWLRPVAVVTGQVRQQNTVMLILILIAFGLMFVYVPMYGAVAGAAIKSIFYSGFSLLSLLLFLLYARNHLSVSGL